MDEHFRKIKWASIYGIIGNLFLAIIKISSSILSNSQAMLANAFNSTRDVFSSFITLIELSVNQKIRIIIKDMEKLSIFIRC